MEFVEFQDFGWNAVTICFFGTIFFMLLQVWGTFAQAKTIWQKKSGLSVSVPLFAYSIGSFFISFLYGISIKSLALILVCGTLCLMHLPIMAGLVKYKEFKNWEKLFIVALILVVVICSLIPYKDYVYLTFNIGTIAMLCFQPWEIWRNKDAGSVEPRLNATYFLSTLFLLIYGIAINDWVIQIISPCYSLFHISIIIMWFVYKKPSQ